MCEWVEGLQRFIVDNVDLLLVVSTNVLDRVEIYTKSTMWSCTHVSNYMHHPTLLHFIVSYSTAVVTAMCVCTCLYIQY
jgi:hypothetical protein